MTRKEDEDTLAIEKMKLVRVDGLLKNLDSVIYNCCLLYTSDAADEL